MKTVDTFVWQDVKTVRDKDPIGESKINTI